MRIAGAAVSAPGIIVLGYSWLQVRAGRWSHVDASVRHERSSACTWPPRCSGPSRAARIMSGSS